ncbi:MAG: STAS/SEC14 domain-containing protein [Pseudomonadota bacterium]|nr:STAS/SEC14 domain-containing protein [Pseudomonadota bacterium]
MLGHTTDPETGVIEITVDGAMTRADYDAVVAAIESAMTRHGKVRMVEIIRSVGHIDSSIWWRDVKWGFTHMGSIGRCAVVTDKGWIGSITRAVGALMPAEIRVFPLADLEEARGWVASE